MYSANRAQPKVPAGSNPTSRDRGETVAASAPMQNKATVQGARMDMMMNAAGQHARKAPNKGILR